MNTLFEAWPKTARMASPVTITEKIDGTNAAVVVQPLALCASDATEAARVCVDGVEYAVAAQSRKRLVTPGDDNFGFANWVYGNAEALVRTLGVGRHFGEWWGKGIQRGYGLDERRFWLFNTAKWGDADLSAVSGLGVVPVLATYDEFDTEAVWSTVQWLEDHGSQAAPGFGRPEGVVAFMHHPGLCLKAFTEWGSK